MAEQPIKLLIGHKTFTTFISTLTKLPDTILGRRFLGNFDKTSDNCYFYDRDPTYFGYILDYYRTLIFPEPTLKSKYEHKRWKAELAFWGLTNPMPLITDMSLELPNQSQITPEELVHNIMQDFLKTTMWTDIQRFNQIEFSWTFTEHKLIDLDVDGQIKQLNVFALTSKFIDNGQVQRLYDTFKQCYRLRAHIRTDSVILTDTTWPSIQRPNAYVLNSPSNLTRPRVQSMVYEFTRTKRPHEYLADMPAAKQAATFMPDVEDEDIYERYK